MTIYGRYITYYVRKTCMNTKPIISVIIPIYNTEKYLSQCLETVVNQTFKNLEIICINDGSTDSSLKIIQKYAQKDNRIKIIDQKNKGLCASRNNGLKASTGKYISFIDSDDYIDLDYYEKHYKALCKYDADISCSGFYHERLPDFSINYNKEQIYCDIDDKIKITQAGIYGYVWRYVFSRDLLFKNDLCFEEGRVIEDVIFTISAIYYSNLLVTIPQSTYFYRHNNNSLLCIKDKAAQKRIREGVKKSDADVILFAKQHGFKVPLLKNPVEKNIKIRILGLPLFSYVKYKKRSHIYFCGLKIIKIK